MYKRYSDKKLVELIKNGKRAIIINSISTNDPDEFINNILIILQNHGVNTNIFNVPFVVNKSIMVLPIRVNSHIDEDQYRQLMLHVNNIVPATTIEAYTNMGYIHNIIRHSK